MKRSQGFTLIELLIVVAIIGIIAAIAIPSLLRARVSANEAAAIGDTRAVISAEVAYHSTNSGYYGLISCLSAPGNAACIPGYGGPTFLDPYMGSLVSRAGYNRAANYSGAGSQPGDVGAFCYEASPTSPNQTGVRSFGGDSTAVVGVTTGAFNCCVSGILSSTCSSLR